MATLFPSSYLSTASQPWGREVEKQLVNLKLTVDSNEVNNSARDQQLASSYKRLDKAVNDVAAATLSAATAADKANQALAGIISVEEAVYYPGTNEIDGGNIRANTIAANKISVGTLTGFTIQTAFSGQRVLIGGDDLSNVKFYDSSNIITGEIVADSSIFNLRNVKGGNGLWGTGARSSLELGEGSATLYLNNGSFAASLTMGVTLSTFSNTVEAYGFSAGLGGVSTTGSISGSSMTSDSTSTRVTAGYIRCLDTYNRNVQSGRIMYVSSEGTYNSASSSKRYKQDIAPYSVDIDKLLLLEPVSFRYKQSVAEFGDDADVAHGFIAEQADEIGLTEFVDYELDEEGNPRPDNFRYIDFTAALLGAVKQLNARVTELENK